MSNFFLYLLIYCCCCCCFGVVPLSFCFRVRALLTSRSIESKVELVYVCGSVRWNIRTKSSSGRLKIGKLLGLLCVLFAVISEDTHTHNHNKRHDFVKITLCSNLYTGNCFDIFFFFNFPSFFKPRFFNCGLMFSLQLLLMFFVVVQFVV